jgi:hypothetical protein
MLAWVHGALAGERELAEALLLPSGARMRRDIGAARVFGAEESKEEEWMRELVDGAVGRICAPLKVRRMVDTGLGADANLRRHESSRHFARRSQEWARRRRCKRTSSRSSYNSMRAQCDAPSDRMPRFPRRSKSALSSCYRTITC